MPQVFEARPKRARIFLYMLGCLAFLAGSLWILFVPGALDTYRRSAWVINAAAWLGLPFFAICLVVFARMFASSDAQIRIDQRGLTWRRWSSEPIPFAAIAEAWPARLGAADLLCLRLHDPARYPPRNALLRITAGPNRAMGTGDVTISTNGLDRTIDELTGALEAWRATSARR